MLVYRVCRKDEIDKIFRDYNYTEIGSFCKNEDKNNHKYESNKSKFSDICTIYFRKCGAYSEVRRKDTPNRDRYSVGIDKELLYQCFGA